VTHRSHDEAGGFRSTSVLRFLPALGLLASCSAAAARSPALAPTPPEVIAVNQQGSAPRQVLERPDLRVWRSRASDGGEHVAVFNLYEARQSFDLAWSDVGLDAGRRQGLEAVQMGSRILDPARGPRFLAPTRSSTRVETRSRPG
jgi:hypothetical protein